MRKIECSTQDDVDAAVAIGDIAVVRAGEFSVGGSARVYASGSAVVDANGSAVVHARDSARVTARGSAVVHASGSAVVRASGSAAVYDRGSAAVYDRITKAPLRRRRPRAVIAPIGSRDDSLGASLPDDGSDPYVYAGCWHGTLSAFEQQVAEVYPAGQYGDEYRAAIAFIRAMAAIKEG